MFEDGTYAVKVGGREVIANPETHAPLSPGQPVWVSDVWTPASYDLNTGVFTPGKFTPGKLTPGHFSKPVIRRLRT